jgi:hypothetical protein
VPENKKASLKDGKREVLRGSRQLFVFKDVRKEILWNKNWLQKHVFKRIKLIQNNKQNLMFIIAKHILYHIR